MPPRLIINKVDGTEQDASAVSPVFDRDGQALVKMGMQWADGQASAGEALLIDDSGGWLNGILSIPGHAHVTLQEYVTGCAYWLSRSRRSSFGARRGLRKGGNATDFPLSTDDSNVELRNPHFTEDWVRPEETDYERLVALQAYQWNGASSTAPHPREDCFIVATGSHRMPNSNTVTMPAHTYELGSTAEDVVRDCAETAGKTYGVTIHHGPASGSAADIVDTFGVGYYQGPLTKAFLDVSGSDDSRMLVAFVNMKAANTGTAVYWRPQAGTTGQQAFSKLGNLNAYGCELECWYLLNPDPTPPAYLGLSYVAQTAHTGSTNGPASLVGWYLKNAVQSLPSILASASGGSPSSTSAVDIAAGGGLVLEATGAQETSSAAWSATPDASQTSAGLFGHASGAFGDPDHCIAGSSKDGAAAGTTNMTWTSISSSADYLGWVQLAVSIPGTDPGSGGPCSHLCLQYIVPTDTTTNVSTLKISDRYADWDPDNLTAPVVEPIWDSGDTTIDTQEQISALVSRYGVDTSAAVFVEDAAASAQDVLWTDVYDDSDSSTAAQAGVRASAVVQTRKFGHPTVPLSIILRDDQAHLVGAGSLVQLKSAVAAGGTYLDTYVNRRVAECVFEPLSPEKMHRLTGTLTYGYRVHLSLDRPPKRVRTRKGKLAAEATTPHTATQLPYTPTGPLTSTNVQAAIDELQAEIDALPADTVPSVSAPGSTSTDIDDSFYNAFPAICLSRDGATAYRAWRRATDHTSIDGVIRFQSGSVAQDGTITWGSVATVWSESGQNVGDPSLACLSDGTLVLCAVVNDAATIGANYFSYLRTSTDGGTTWAAKVAIGSSLGTGGNHREVASAPVIELPNGKYGLPIWGRTTAMSTDKALFLYATSLNGPWTEVTLADNGSLWYSEPQAHVLDTGRLFFLIREENNRRTYSAYSDDHGVTITSPALIFEDAFGKPRFAQLNSGALLWIGREDDATVAGCRAMYSVSYDRGVTWTARAYLGAATERMLYADILVIPNSSAVVATWSIETGTTDADILSGVFTDVEDVRFALTPWLRVREEDGSPAISGIRELRFTSGSVTNDGQGVVSVSAGGGALPAAVAGHGLFYDGATLKTAQPPEPLLLEDTSLAVLENGHVAMSEPTFD